MQKFSTTFILCFILTQAFGQNDCKTSLYLGGQYNQTISDATLGNNPWGIGLGLQIYFRQRSMFKPTVELTADVYFMNDKVYRRYLDGMPIRTIGSMVILFCRNIGSSHSQRLLVISSWTKHYW